MTINPESVKAHARELLEAEERGYQRGWNAAMESKAKRSACSDTDGARQGEAMEVGEEIDGHRWGKFTASSVLGGKDWEVCFNCGMIRRADKKNSPCKGRAKVGPRA